MASTTFDYIGDLQYFTVPQNVNSITITAIGAKGGPIGYGGYGASITGNFAVTPGYELTILVGGAGGSGPLGIGGTGGGGGGGSFVWHGSTVTDISKATLLVAAGGGGGASYNSTGLNANTENDGYAGEYGGNGGTDGNGGSSSYGGGGAGIAGNGGGSGGGYSIYNGGTGGSKVRDGGSGGFGGGGGGCAYMDADHHLFVTGGGGGGYSGGGAGGYQNNISGSGGGGGSYNADPNGTNIISDIADNGQVIINYTLAPTRGIPLF